MKRKAKLCEDREARRAELSRREVLRVKGGMKTRISGEDAEEGKGRAGAESVALHHSAAAMLTDSYSPTVCTGWLSDWLVGWQLGCSSVPTALPLSPPPSLFLSLSNAPS